jgi:hypothetical protein
MNSHVCILFSSTGRWFFQVRSSMTTKNDYGRPEFVTKLSEWRPEIFFYSDAEIYSFQILWVDFPKLPLKKNYDNLFGILIQVSQYIISLSNFRKILPSALGKEPINPNPICIFISLNNFLLKITRSSNCQWRPKAIMDDLNL